MYPDFLNLVNDLTKTLTCQCIIIEDNIRHIYENVISFHEIENERLLVIETDKGYTIINKTVEPKH